MGIVVEIPKDILRSMKVPERELPQRLKVELALRLYQTGLLAFGKARRLLTAYCLLEGGEGGVGRVGGVGGRSPRGVPL